MIGCGAACIAQVCAVRASGATTPAKYQANIKHEEMSKKNVSSCKIRSNYYLFYGSGGIGEFRTER